MLSITWLETSTIYWKGIVRFLMLILIEKEMANHALSLPQGLHILDSLPKSVSRIMIEDIIGVSFPCSCIV